MLDSPVQQIKDRLDIVEVIGSYLKLQKAGASYKAICPFHSEKTPSFFISPARQIWHCFGSCGTGGDIFKFVMQIEGVEFGEALRILAQKAGIELKSISPQLKTERQRLAEICEWACCFFEKQLEGSVRGREVRDYLLSRGISDDSVKKWRLGYAPDKWQALSDFSVGKGYGREEVEKAGLAIRKQESPGFRFYDRFRARIMFPIFDLNSRPVGFGGRIFNKAPGSRLQALGGDEAKYINTPNTLLYDKSRILYGLDKAKLAIRKKNYCILVEGYTDVILVSQAGFENVAATSGTALTPYQLNILKRYSDNLFTGFDMDLAGQSATKRGIDLAESQGFNIKVISVPEGLDPADLVAKSLTEWQEAVKMAKSIMEFYFESAFADFEPKVPEKKKEIAGNLLPLIKRIPNKIEQSHWIQELAKRLETKEEDVFYELHKLKSNPVSVIYNKPLTVKPQEQKSRLDLLEERLIGLILIAPFNIGLVQDRDLQFFSPEISRLLSYFREKGVNKAEWDETPIGFSPQLTEMLNQLWLRLEVFPSEINPEAEAKECLKEIKKLKLKEKCEEISLAVKKAESENDAARVRQLMQEFNQLHS